MGNLTLTRTTLAITHVPSPKIVHCQLTYVERVAIDYSRAIRQHEGYCQMLRQCGAQVLKLDVNHDLPDCSFVEDTAIVLDEVAVLASMGTESRQTEPAGIEPELRKYREVHRIEAPAAIEGGDVLLIGRTLLVGLSQRTNPAGMGALETVAGRYGYRVVPVPVRHCLHLKTACSLLYDRSLLVNPEWLDTQALRDFEFVPVPDEEPWAANLVHVGSSVCMAANHIRTADMIRDLGLDVQTVDISEFAKAEGGVTCLSLLLQL